MNNKQQRWFLLLIISFIWGTSFILMKKALLELSPIQIGAIRIIFTTIALLVVGYKLLYKISKREWWYITITAILGTFFPVFLFAYAIQNIDSSIVSIINSITPLTTLIIGTLFYGVVFIKKQIIGIIIGLVGVAALIFQGAEINTEQNYNYAILIVIASLGYAINVNIIKKHLNNLNALALTTGNFILLIIPSVIILWFTDFFKHETLQTSYISLWYVFLLAVFGTALAKTLFNRLIQISSPIFSTSVTYLIPVVAIFWGSLDGENLHLSQLIMGSLILFGIYLTTKGK